jgi:hypothetical protein
MRQSNYRLTCAAVEATGPVPPNLLA